MCGENAEGKTLTSDDVGSYPRVRGKPGHRARSAGSHGLIPARAGKTGGWRSRAAVGGLIPARAGKTSAAAPRLTRIGAHPRVCGENSESASSPTRTPGSSPRVRGKPHVVGDGVPLRVAHPRACGENRLQGRDQVGFRGSSPRVRGKRLWGTARDFRTGLIPACAGKTSVFFAYSDRSAAHPRVCGENMTCTERKTASRGSSPRVRGKPVPGFRVLLRRGLIPARAGKTPCCSSRARPWTAHPRACGENAQSHYRRFKEFGSSPRLRGKLGTASIRGSAGGLIPARAGKTPRRLPRPAHPPAHPRACGENHWINESHCALLGSSPRVRGKHVLAHPGRQVLGLIPARAGKTYRGIRP